MASVKKKQKAQELRRKPLVDLSQGIRRKPLVNGSFDEDDVIRRAFAAWFRGGGRDQPANTSSVQEHGGKFYVELHNVNGTLAVYRVRNDGVLKRLKRWPKTVEDY